MKEEGERERERQSFLCLTQRGEGKRDWWTRGMVRPVHCVPACERTRPCYHSCQGLHVTHPSLPLPFLLLCFTIQSRVSRLLLRQLPSERTAPSDHHIKSLSLSRCSACLMWNSENRSTAATLEEREQERTVGSRVTHTPSRQGRKEWKEWEERERERGSKNAIQM